jgi:Abortive infection alpha
LGIPLLRAAYDEGRPELQDIWAALIAAAMDPERMGRVRISFIDTLKRFDPLDARVLAERYKQSEMLPNPLQFISAAFQVPHDEILFQLKT